MLDNPQRFQPEGCNTRIHENSVPKKVSRNTLYTFFSEAGDPKGAQQLGPTSRNEHKPFVISFQQSQTDRCALTTMHGLSLGGCKIGRGQSRPGSQVDDSPSFHSYNSRSIGGKYRLGDKAENSPGARFTNKHAGNFHPNLHKGTSDSAQEKFHNASRAESRGVNSYTNCNLYILNLSLSMTNEGLKAVIQASGEVKHVCVLATLDNAGRRRAFVDMATSEEACRVVENLHGKKIEGYELHVSYAFIQRSGGPTMPFDGNSGSKSHKQRLPSHQDAKIPCSTSRKAEDREKHYGTKKPLSTAASIGSKVTRTTKPKLNPLSQMNSDSQFVPPLDPSRTPESDADGSFPLTPVSCYDPRVTSLTTPSSVLFETAVPELNSSAPFEKFTACSPWKLLVFNLSPVACIDSDDLFRFFIREGFSRLTTAYLNVDSDTGMSLANGTLTFDRAEDYHKAFETISSREMTFGGAKIKCIKLNASDSNKHLTTCVPGSNSDAPENLTPTYLLDSNVNCSVSGI